MIEKKPFVRYTLEEDQDKEDFSKSIWVNKEIRQLLYSVGSMMRQSQISTIIKQSLEIVEAKLIGDHKLINIIYGNGLRNKRKGMDDIEIVQQELRKILGGSHR